MLLTQYTALRESAVGEIEVSRSRFLCTLFPVLTDEAARQHWAATRAAYHDARHHCLALVIGPDGSLRRSSDDGEPSGTAGAPMLDVLEGSGVRDVVAIVTRWFGGTLLGAGGLIRAYSDSVRQGLANAKTKQRALVTEQSLTINIADAGSIEAELRRQGFSIVGSEWGAEVTLTVASNTETAARLNPFLAAATQGRTTARVLGTRWADVS